MTSGEHSPGNSLLHEFDGESDPLLVFFRRTNRGPVRTQLSKRQVVAENRESRVTKLVRQRSQQRRLAVRTRAVRENKRISIPTGWSMQKSAYAGFIDRSKRTFHWQLRRHGWVIVNYSAPRVTPLKISKTLAVTISLFCAVAADSQTPAPTLTDNPIYVKNCAKCHGKNAEGKHLLGGPSLVDEKATSASADDLKKIITDGKGHMPKYAGKLTPEEIDTLVLQIKAKK